MEQYIVTGMSCAACQARVEKAVSKVPGVESCAVSLLTNSMGVEGTASAEDIIKAVENAGYGARPKSSQFNGASSDSLNVTQKTGASQLSADEEALKDQGDGHRFADAEIILLDDTFDRDVCAKYIEQLGGKIPAQYKDPMGQGRIKIK